MLNLILLDAGWVTDLTNFFLENANYWWVFLLMVIESSFIPFPSEVVVPPAVYLALQNDAEMSVTGVVLVATVGALVGALVNYYLAIWLGRPLIYKFVNSRLGHILLLSQESVEKAEKYFEKKGSISTFIGRLIPGIRQLISIPAGLSRMKISKFVFFTALGAFIWNIALAVLGYFITTIPGIETKEDLLAKVEEYNVYLTYGGLAIGVVCIIFILWNIFKPKKTVQTEK